MNKVTVEKILLKENSIDITTYNVFCRPLDAIYFAIVLISVKIFTSINFRNIPILKIWLSSNRFSTQISHSFLWYILIIHLLFLWLPSLTLVLLCLTNSFSQKNLLQPFHNVQITFRISKLLLKFSNYFKKLTDYF